MRQVGIRELKNDAPEIVRAVREEHAEYVITLRGRPVAMILPVDEATVRPMAPSDELRSALAELRAQIAAEWQSDKGALELLREQRR